MNGIERYVVARMVPHSTQSLRYMQDLERRHNSAPCYYELCPGGEEQCDIRQDRIPIDMLNTGSVPVGDDALSSVHTEETEVIVPEHGVSAV
jgi:hypothetical protein